MYLIHWFDGHSQHLVGLVGRVAFGEYGEGEDKVEAGGAEQHRDHGHSVGNLKYSWGDVDSCQRSSDRIRDREGSLEDGEDDDPASPVPKVAGKPKGPDADLMWYWEGL